MERAHGDGAAGAVELTGVRRVYPAARRRPERVALDGVSLRIERGERVALLGPNGSGKSTLLRILATLDRPDAGSAVVLGRRVGHSKDERAVRARIGVVFQTAGLDPLLTVRENLLAQASLFGLAGAGARERVERAAGALGVTDRLGERVGTLSGGLARRVDLARALLHGPDLLLLDEPTAGLDPLARAEFWDVVAGAAGALPADAPLTVVASSHLMDEADRAGRVVLLDEGRVLADAAPAELRQRVGSVVVRCLRRTGGADTARAASILGSYGFEVVVGRDGNAVGRPARDAASSLEDAIVALTRAGAPFEVGPPTLDETYLTLIGSRGDGHG